MTESNSPFQWVKPLAVGDIPDGTFPVWDSVNQAWIFEPLVKIETPDPVEFIQSNETGTP